MVQEESTNPENKKSNLFEAFQIILANWQRAAIMQGAAEMAYFLLLSLVPILLVLANVIPLLPFDPAEIISLVENSFPEDISGMLIPIVRGYMESGSGGAISIGLLAAIWSASNVFNTLRRVLDEVYGAEVKKNFIIARILSMLIMVSILFIVAFAIFIFVFGEQILNFISDIFEIDIPFIQEFLLARWITLPIILFLVTIVIYHLVPNHHLKIKYAMPGAAFATVGLLLLSQFFSLISRVMGGDAIANQTLGGFIVLMLFLYLANVIVLFGALLNTLTFELKNRISVLDYEVKLRQLEESKEAKWHGYPDESEVKVLKRKIYKIE